MIDCEACTSLAKKYLEKTISPGELAELKAHAEACPKCREEFKTCLLVEEVIRDAFVPRTTSAEGRQRVLAKITSQVESPAPPLSQPGWLDWLFGIMSEGDTWLIGARRTMTAVLLLGIGLASGLFLARQPGAKPPESPKAAIVPMHVTALEGTILVRPAGADLWRPLRTNSTIHLGDTFHAMAKSSFTLRTGDAGTLEVKPNSTVALKNVSPGTQFHLEHGKVAATLNSPHPPFVISTPQGQVEALGTEFTVTVE